MALTNSTEYYGKISKLLHWSFILLIVGLLVLGSIMGDFPKPLRFELYAIHKSLGLLTLAIAVIAIIWTFFNKKPAYPQNMSSWQLMAAKITRNLLYFSMLMMPLCGWFMSTAAGHIPNFFGFFEVPAPIAESESLANLFSTGHLIFAWTLVVLSVIHIAAALKHHYIDKDNVLRRMLKLS